jgi:hypothetical protein
MEEYSALVTLPSMDQMVEPYPQATTSEVHQLVLSLLQLLRLRHDSFPHSGRVNGYLHLLISQQMLYRLVEVPGLPPIQLLLV